jgi:hypothetical protein
MKRLISLTVLAGLSMGLSAFGADNNSFPIPNVQRTQFSIIKPVTLEDKSNFETKIAYQDNLDACVNLVAQACDGHFTRKLSRALSKERGKVQDISEGATLAVELNKLAGITHCGHYSGQTGEKREMVAFTKGSSLILFGLPHPESTDKCQQSEITLSGEANILDMKVTQNKVWLIGGTSHAVYYAGADFKVRVLGTLQQPVRATSMFAANATMINFTQDPKGAKVANDETSNTFAGATRGTIDFEEVSEDASSASQALLAK